ncbi:MAG: ABC transporter ATP-binding protein, partial [Spirochaetales bacterium]|nr:ABC transporter ATP-binding protein [Spirochaetales bacterium]
DKSGQKFQYSLLFAYSMNTAITIKDLQFKYPVYNQSTSQVLFDTLSAVFQSGMVHTVYGRPEAGKTTLGRILSGLVPAFTGGNISGEVQIGKVEVLESRGYDLTEYIGMVFQDPDEQILMPQVEDEIVFPLESLGMNRPQIHERLEEEIAFWDLDELRIANPANLSGGEKKRVLLAALCAINPSVWVLDETFEELDEQWRETLIKRAVESGKTIIILASKHIELYNLYVSTWSIIHDKQIFQGSKDQVLNLLGDNWEYKQLHPSMPYISRSVFDTQESILSVRNLTFTYPQGNSDFTLFVDKLDIHSGRITAFYGPNGSGKTTLSKLLCGLLTPDKGKILFPDNGPNHKPATAGALQKFTGYLFQNPDYQIFLPTVKDELMYSLLQAGINKDDAQRQADACAELFGLTNPNETPSTMSYGSRKRLQAAVCYLLDRVCCIFDEADSGILMSEYIRIVDLFVKREASLILITHDFRLAEKLADTIVEFQDGRAQETSND